MKHQTEYQKEYPTEYPKEEVSLSPAILVGLVTRDREDIEDAMDELEALSEACEFRCVARMVQPLDNPNPATYIGSGKLKELSQLVDNMEIENVVFLDTLSPAQLKNISDEVNARIYDRTGLILEIFAKRAKTREARLQVETANLQYMLPRLVGMRTSLGRQGGGSGSMSNKGQGEKQIDLDRRHIEKRISELRRELNDIEQNREVLRKARKKDNIPCVALAGYTNAGKSTIMNYLVSLSGASDDKKVLQKDMLFATLDTTVRRIATGDKKDFLLSDTVGFVADLPHTLVKAFRSTLEEVMYSDLILIVTDASDEKYREQIDITENTLKEIGAGEIPRLYVMNKADRLDEGFGGSAADSDRIYVSAKTGAGMDTLLCEIRKQIYAQNREVELLIPYTEGSLLNYISENARIISRDYEADGTHVRAEVPVWLEGKISSVIK